MQKQFQCLSLTIDFFLKSWRRFRGWKRGKEATGWIWTQAPAHGLTSKGVRTHHLAIPAPNKKVSFDRDKVSRYITEVRTVYRSNEAKISHQEELLLRYETPKIPQVGTVYGKIELIELCWSRVVFITQWVFRSYEKKFWIAENGGLWN